MGLCNESLRRYRRIGLYLRMFIDDEVQSMKAEIADLLKKIPGPASAEWPMGEPFTLAFAHGTMSVEIYAPVETDPQSPHSQDELYFIISGAGIFVNGEERLSFSPGSAFFVPAGQPHRFENFSSDFATWVVFWGPHGGER